MQIKKTIKIIASIVIALMLLIQQDYFYKQDVKVNKVSNEFVESGAGLYGNYSSNEYLVIKVIDGDTIKIQNSEIIETVRLIGINTPESVDPRKPVQCFGIEASNKTKEVLLGQRVKIMQDETQQKRDKYNRMLAYVNRSSDDLFVNKFLIEEGYAYEYTYNVPYKFQLDFKKTEKYARENKRGMWADGACSTKK